MRTFHQGIDGQHDQVINGSGNNQERNDGIQKIACQELTAIYRELNG